MTNNEGKMVWINDDIPGILEQLKTAIDYKLRESKNRHEIITSLEKQIKEMRDEAYKDKELQRLRDENDGLRKELNNSFLVSDDEQKKIDEWINEWFKTARKGNRYMGAIGGGFTYSFMPTGLGTIGKVIAPDGKEFVFSEIG